MGIGNEEVSRFLKEMNFNKITHPKNQLASSSSSQSYDREQAK